MKKVVGFIGMVAVLLVTNGCSHVKNASLRSYQGPLPMDDYQYVNAESYGVPVRNTK